MLIPPTAATKTSAAPTATSVRRPNTASSSATRAASMPSVRGRRPDRTRAEQRLHLDQERPPALEHRDDDAARDAGHAVAQEHRARVRHGPQAVVAHLEDPHLAGGAEAVLDRGQDAQGVVAVAVEGEDGVDQVLDGPGPGQVAVLGHVADQDDGHPGRLGQPGQPVHAGSDLGQAPRRPRQLVVADGLDGVDHARAGRWRSMAASMAATSCPARARRCSGTGPIRAGAPADLGQRLLGGRQQHLATGGGGAADANTWKRRVDLPTPGGPKTRVTEPETKPPASTRSTSAMPVGIGRASRPSTWRRETAPAPGGETAPGRVADRVFHRPQCGQRPTHRAATPSHSVHR